MATVFLFVLQPGHNRRTLREGRLSTEHRIRFRMEAHIILLDVEIFRQLYRAYRIERKSCVDWCLVEYRGILWKYRNRIEKYLVRFQSFVFDIDSMDVLLTHGLYLVQH